jgi:hypothetical protein
MQNTGCFGIRCFFVAYGDGISVGDDLDAGRAEAGSGRNADRRLRKQENFFALF